MIKIKLQRYIEQLTGKNNFKMSPPPPKFNGDISTNAAMVTGINSDELIEKLEEYDDAEYVEKVGPGFINIKFNFDSLKKELVEIVEDQENYGRLFSGRKDILFEMVSSNPTGPLHIGHGRGAAIGDALARIYTRIGFNVEREYYVNDAGRQMNLLGESVLARINNKPVPEDGYKGEYLNDVAAELKDCSSAEECRDKAGSLILQSHLDVLSEFRVEYNSVFSEKTMVAAGKVEEIIEELKNKKLTYENDGALWFRSTDYGDDQDRVLIKNDGQLTYFASDCAYHWDKSKRFKNLVDIWGADHHGYVPRMKAFWKAMGLEGELDVLLYQLVNLKRNGEKVAMSTRQGEFITLQDIISEVGADRTRFFMLMRSSDAPLEFDVDLAKEESKNNPVYYVQYSHARICSVFRKKGIKTEDVKADTSALGDEEKPLLLLLAEFPILLDKISITASPHLLTEYVRELASLFHKYYDNNRIIGSEKENSQLYLLKGIKIIIRISLELLGVEAPEKM